jgi:hypothetical protein
MPSKKRGLEKLKKSPLVRGLVSAAQTLGIRRGKNAQHLEGALHKSLESRNLVGWVWDRHRPEETLSVTVYDGDAKLGKILANRFRQDLLDGGRGTGRYGFVFPLPEFIFDGQVHELRAVVEDHGYELQRSPLEFCTGESAPVSRVRNWLSGDKIRDVQGSDYDGVCERLQTVVVRGWALDTQNPQEPLVLSCYDNGEWFEDVRADQLRNDLKRAGIGTGWHGYQLSLPDRFFDGETHTLDIRVKDADLRLRNAPMTITPRRLREVLLERIEEDMQKAASVMARMEMYW